MALAKSPCSIPHWSDFGGRTTVIIILRLSNLLMLGEIKHTEQVNTKLARKPELLNLGLRVVESRCNSWTMGLCDDQGQWGCDYVRRQKVSVMHFSEAGSWDVLIRLFGKASSIAWQGGHVRGGGSEASLFSWGKPFWNLELESAFKVIRSPSPAAV